MYNSVWEALNTSGWPSLITLQTLAGAEREALSEEKKRATGASTAAEA